MLSLQYKERQTAPKGIKNKEMIRTTSLRHYKELKKKGVSVKLVTRQEINKNNN